MALLTTTKIKANILEQQVIITIINILLDRISEYIKINYETKQRAGFFVIASILHILSSPPQKKTNSHTLPSDNTGFGFLNSVICYPVYTTVEFIFFVLTAHTSLSFSRLFHSFLFVCFFFSMSCSSSFSSLLFVLSFSYTLFKLFLFIFHFFIKFFNMFVWFLAKNSA